MVPIRQSAWPHPITELAYPDFLRVIQSTLDNIGFRFFLTCKKLSGEFRNESIHQFCSP